MSSMSILLPVLAVKPWVVVTIVVAVVLIAALIALSIYGKKLQDRQEQSQKEMQAASQSASLLVIDKRRMKLKEAGLPQIVLDQTPKRFRGQKVPIVKAKIGAKIMSFMCDEKIFEHIPIKKEVRATISGIYIMDIKGGRTVLEAKPTKMKFGEKMRAKMNRQLEKAKQLEKKSKKK